MARRRKMSDSPVHFISGYVHRRVPLFRLRPDFAQLFLKTLEFYRRKKQLRIFAFVIMPDHYHLLLGFPPTLKPADFLRDFKSYVGKQAVERLRAESEARLLRRFHLRRPRKRLRDASYCVLQPDNDDRVIYSERFFRQKRKYIHDNPVRKGLVATPADYPWSSYLGVAKGESGPLRLDTWVA